MAVTRSWLLCFIWAGLGLWTLAGCGKSSDIPADATADSGAEARSGLPTLSIPGQKAPAKGTSASDMDDEEDEDDVDEPDDDNAPVEIPKAGTPERFVHDGTQLLMEAPPKTEDRELLKKFRKEKNEKVVKLSQQAIKLTYKDPEKERVLNLAVHNLMEARTQLALAGDKESIDKLNDDANALFKRNPKSPAALEGAYAQVNLAYGMAKMAASDDQDDQKWLHEFSKLAKLFALNYPDEDRKSLPLLFAAGLSCELADNPKEAISCYSLIRKEFPNSTFAARVAPILKRLKLVGNPPRIEGPTLGGGKFAIDDLLGKIVLVVFWSTETEPFQEQLPALQKIIRKHSKRGLEVVGISLDQDDAVVRQFTLDNKIAWPQIFYKSPEQRGWAHPIVSYYGVQDIPAYWLIDSNGDVATTTVKLSALSAEIEKLLNSIPEKSEN